MHEITRVRNLVTREPVGALDKPALTGWLQRMCRVAARDLPASGVGVSLVSGQGDLMTTAASAPTSAAVEELQFTLGEGPCLLAFESRTPVLVPDLAEMERTVWPAYARAAHDHGVRAVFAFPMQLGATRLGAMDVYRDAVGGLSATALTRALTFAEVAMEALLDSGTTPEEAAALLEDGPGMRYEVYQAQGMVMVQLGVTADVAMARLRAYAFSHGRRLGDVADDVLERRLVLESDDP